MQKDNIVREIEEIIREMRIECKVADIYEKGKHGIMISPSSHKRTLENYIEWLEKIIKD